MKRVIGLMFVIATASQLAMAFQHQEVPEINPSSALGALTLLGGGIMVVRAYFKKK